MPQLSSATITRMDSAFDADMLKYEIPGAIVGFWSPQGNFIKARGCSDLATNEPMSLDNHFRIGSVSKIFTGTIVLFLVQEGKINLDSSVAYYLPEYPFPKAYKITVRMLGNMTSGIFDYTEDNAWMQSCLANNWETVFSPDSLIKVSLQHPLNFEPGTNWSYTNTTPLMLSLICEKVTGKSLKSLMNDRIFLPYNLTNTTWPDNRYLPVPYSHGYSKENLAHVFEDMSLLNPSFAGASGALVSNVYDLSKWMKLLGTGSIYSPAMQTERTTWATGSGNGYGFAIMNCFGLTNFLVLGHGGAIYGYTTFAFYIPSKDITVVVYVNYYTDGEGSPAQSLATDMVIAGSH
jgi:D-alanyl-D-alanine carboxypeptidase